MVRKDGVIEDTINIDVEQTIKEGARWPGDKASDSKSRGPGFDPLSRRYCVLSFRKTITPQSTG